MLHKNTLFFAVLMSLFMPLSVAYNSYAESGEQSYTVASLEFRGNQKIDEAALRLQLTKQSGTFLQSEVSGIVKTLYQTGFFDQVKATLDRGENSSQILVFNLVEKPIVRKVFIEGNDEIDDNALLDIFKLGANRFLDKTKLQSLMKRSIVYYQGRGFYDASFDYSVVPVGEGQVDVTFKVDEGKRYKIKDVRFSGFKLADEGEAEDVIETTDYKWWSSWLLGTGRLSEEVIESDRSAIRQYLLDHGFVDGSVGDAIIKKNKKDASIIVVFPISEGEKYSFGSIGASGDFITNSEETTLEGGKLETGRTFSASELREESFRISEKFTDIGFAFANVVPDTVIDRPNKKVDVVYKIDKGLPVKVRRINIKGNKKTYDNVIRREIKVKEQELFSSSKLTRSQQLLQRLGIFEGVNVSTVPIDEKDKVDVLFDVTEASTGTLSAGAGYSSADGAIFTGRISEENLFGTGRRVSLLVDAGTQRDNIVLSFLDRRVMDSYVAAGADALIAQRRFTDFDRRLAGGGISLGYPLEEVFGESFEDISSAVRYEYLDIEIDNITEDAATLVKEAAGTSSSSSITPSLTRNTIDNPLNPTEGSLQNVSFELAGLGGTEDFWLLEAKNTLYEPLTKGEWGSLVFSLRTSVAYGETSNGDDRFPLFKRYFPGGINSVRGYKNRTLGPVDEFGNEYGGSKEFVNNTEIIFPIVESAGLRGVLFHDIGEAFDDNQSIQFADLRQAWGFGLRWTSPLGPIRIEFGFPIDKQDGDESTVTMFSFGAPL